LHAHEWPKQDLGGYGGRMKLGPDLLERMKRLFRFHPGATAPVDLAPH
jgi:hypothetical protein